MALYQLRAENRLAHDVLVLYACDTHARHVGYIMALIHFQPMAFSRCSMSSNHSVNVLFYVCSRQGDIRHKTHTTFIFYTSLPTGL